MAAMHNLIMKFEKKNIRSTIHITMYKDKRMKNNIAYSHGNKFSIVIPLSAHLHFDLDTTISITNVLVASGPDYKKMTEK